MATSDWAQSKLHGSKSTTTPVIPKASPTHRRQQDIDGGAGETPILGHTPVVEPDQVLDPSVHVAPPSWGGVIVPPPFPRRMRSS